MPSDGSWKGRRGRGALAAACTIGILVVLGSATPAAAAPTTQIVQGSVIRLVSVADWDAASSLLPGQPVRWDVAVSADTPDPGQVTVSVSASGEAPLRVDVAQCATQWEVAGCRGGATVLRSAWDIQRDGSEVALTEFADTEVAYLRLVVTLSPEPGSGGDVVSGSTDIRVHAQGAGESVAVGPGGDGLAMTGPPSRAPWILIAGAGLVAAGAALGASRRRLRDGEVDAR